MIEILAALVFTSILAMIWGYFIHMIVHKKWSGRLYQNHYFHHFKNYPPFDFQSEKYRSSGKNSTTLIFLAMSIPAGLIPLGLWYFGVIQLSTAAIMISQMGLIGFVNSFLHDSFHIKNHFIGKIPGFKRIYQNLIAKHLIHHKFVERNFGIYEFAIDRVLGTFKSK